MKFEVKFEVVGCCPVSYARTLIGCSGRKERQRRRKRRNLDCKFKILRHGPGQADKGQGMSAVETGECCVLLFQTFPQNTGDNTGVAVETWLHV